MMHGYLTIP